MDLQLDEETGKFALTANGDLAMVTGADAILQYVLEAIKTFLGEWFLDTTIGIPYYESILKKNPDQVTIESALKARILACPGMQELTDFSMTAISATRKLNVQFKGTSTSGPVTFNENVGV